MIFYSCFISLLPSQLEQKNTPTASRQRGKIPPMSVLDIDTKQSDGETSVIEELWGKQSTHSLPSLPGPFWPGVVAPDEALSMRH